MNFHETIADRLARQQQRDGIPNKQPSNTETRSNRVGFERNVQALKEISWAYQNGYALDRQTLKDVFGMKDIEEMR